MSKCPNCGANLSCGCQRRVASNGASVCSNCLASYERNLKDKNQIKKATVPPKKLSQPGTTDPSDVNITVTRIEYL